MARRHRPRTMRHDRNKEVRRLKRLRSEEAVDLHVPPPGRAHTCTVVDPWPAPDCIRCQREFSEYENRSRPSELLD